MKLYEKLKLKMTNKIDTIGESIALLTLISSSFMLIISISIISSSEPMKNKDYISYYMCSIASWICLAYSVSNIITILYAMHTEGYLKF